MLQSLYERNDLLKNIHEEPAAVPIYEGHLYWYSDKQKWKWHLFRFDGLSLICLSTRKVKLPRDTPIEQHNNDSNDPPSPTSPLLATPTKRSYRTKDNVLMASHYQLPTWSLNLKQVASISLLVRDDNKTQQKQHCNCFCLRTVDKQYYLLKTRKYKETERWLFILTKAWHWVQFEQHIMQRLPSTPPQLPPLNISGFDDKSRQPTEPPTPPPPPVSLSLPIAATATAAATESPQRHQQYQHPILSAEKEKWIHEWRSSLQPMTKPPPSHKPRHSADFPVLLNEPTMHDGDDYYRQHPTASMNMTVSNMCPFVKKVKKRRSDEVQNWIPGNYQDYDIPYFQDANTTDHANSTLSSKHSSGGEQQLQQLSSSSSFLHYHRSSRGKTVQIFNNNHHQHHQAQQANLHAFLPFDHHSPLSELSKIESTDDVYKLLQLQQSSHHSSSTGFLQSKDKQRPQSTPTFHHTIYHPHRRPAIGSSSATIPTAPAVPSLPPLKNPSYTLFGSTTTTALTPLKNHLPFMKSSSSTIGRGSFNSGSSPKKGTLFGRSKISLHSLV